jgi:hypothetical protein
MPKERVLDLVDNVFAREVSGPHIEQAATDLRAADSTSVEALIEVGADPKRAHPAMKALGWMQLRDERAIDFLIDRLHDEQQGGDNWRMALASLYRIGGDRCEAVLAPVFAEFGVWPDKTVDQLVARHGNVREIGKELDRLGGFGLMVEVHRRVAQHDPGHARRLEVLWDGVGLWQGCHRSRCVAVLRTPRLLRSTRTFHQVGLIDLNPAG